MNLLTVTIRYIRQNLAFNHGDFQPTCHPLILVAQELELVWHLLLDARDDSVNGLAVTSATAVVEGDGVGG